MFEGVLLSQMCDVLFFGDYWNRWMCEFLHLSAGMIDNIYGGRTRKDWKTAK